MGLTAEGAIDITNRFVQSKPDYFSGISEVTAGNILAVSTELANNPPLLNEFFGTIVNKISETFFNGSKFENPLARFKRATSNYGDTIEEVFVKMAEEMQYDSDPKGNGKRLLSTEDPKVETAYHKLPRVKTYKATIIQREIAKSMRGPNGVTTIVNMIIDQLSKSNSLAEFKYMKALLDGAYKMGDMYLVEVGDIKVDAKEFAAKAREYHMNLKFENTYNARGVVNPTNGDNVTIFMSNKTRSWFDVDTLASAFNMQMADFTAASLPIGTFHDDNIVAMMVDNSFFVVQDREPLQVTSMFFPDSLKYNYFLHVNQIISRSPFATAIAFVKKVPADMKYRLILSTNALVLDDNDRKVREITTTLDGVDGLDPLIKYDLTIETLGNSIVTHSVVDGVITFTLKEDIPAGAVETVRIVATPEGEADEISFERTLAIQKSTLYSLEDYE